MTFKVHPDKWKQFATENELTDTEFAREIMEMAILLMSHIMDTDPEAQGKNAMCFQWAGYSLLCEPNPDENQDRLDITH